MAWQRYPARWWQIALLGLVVGPMGCSDPNPAFDGTGPAEPTEATGSSGDGPSSNSATTVPMTTSPTDGVDVSGGMGACDGPEPAAGMEMRVIRMGGWPNDVCMPQVSEGNLVLTAGGYELYADCNDGSELLMVLDFLPKGPVLTLGQSYCIDYDIAFREGCRLDHAVIRDSEGPMIYAAGTSYRSPVPDVFAVMELPREGVCECDAGCCPDSLAPGPYALGVVHGDQAAEVEQGERKNLETPDGSYEFETLQSRVVQECSDPEQFDWYYRRTAAG